MHKVTETGWPVSGETLNQAVPGADNARIYWEDVTCQLVADNVNLYYYTLQDVQYGNPSPSFGIKPAGDLQSVAPLFDLSCPASSVSPLFPILLSSALSPLLFLLLYNLAIAKSIIQYMLPSIWRCDCPCLNTLQRSVHTSAWATRSLGWTARTNGQAKSSSTRLSSTATASSSIVRSSIRSAVVTSESNEEADAML
jgi:hypothetical protein